MALATTRNPFKFVARAGPYLLSHHPHCDPFAADVFLVRSRRVCVSCAVGYPCLALGVLLGWLWLQRGTTAAPAAGLAHPTGLAVAAAGLTLALPQGLSFAGLAKTRATQAAIKALLGLGFGLLGTAILAAPWALGWRIAVGVLSFTALQSLWGLRILRLERTCRACPQYGLRPGCEGLRDLQARLEERPPGDRPPPVRETMAGHSLAASTPGAPASTPSGPPPLVSGGTTAK